MRIQRLESEHFPLPPALKQTEQPGFSLLLPFLCALFRSFEKSGAVPLETERSPSNICCRVRLCCVCALSLWALQGECCCMQAGMLLGRSIARRELPAGSLHVAVHALLSNAVFGTWRKNGSYLPAWEHLQTAKVGLAAASWSACIM